MKAQLSFDLNNEMDKEFYYCALKSTQMDLFILEFYEKFLRKIRKNPIADGENIICADKGTYINIEHLIEIYFAMQREIISEE